MSFVEQHEALLRILFFLSVLVVMASLEAVKPKKQRTMQRLKRWFTNLALVVIDSVVVRFATPILAVGMASLAKDNNVGLFNWLALPLVVEGVIAFLLLDMLIYFQHVLSHKLPLLWAFHKVHHADRDIDVTTGLRFHPLEILFSMFYKLLCVALLGPTVVVVIVFEIVLNAAALFNHSNVALPNVVDKALRNVIVTPDFHRVHHSTIQNETDSNYGFFLSFWDKLYDTYIEQPLESHDGMTIGLEEYQSEKPKQLLWCLILPWSKKQ